MKTITITKRANFTQDQGVGSNPTQAGGAGAPQDLNSVLGRGNIARLPIVFENPSQSQQSIFIDENGDLVISGNLKVQGDVIAFASGLAPESWWDELAGYVDNETIQYINGKLQVIGNLGGGAWGEITGTLSAQTDLQNALNAKVAANAAITGATKTKITYDSKGLVTGGADLLAADIPALAISKITGLQTALNSKLNLAGGTITGNLSVAGNLTINGTTTTVNSETVNIKDNLILINSNQTGTPPTTLQGGIEVERGDLVNYQFLFDENSDAFKIGMAGNLQKVATREDAPLSGGFAKWNPTAFRFDAVNIANADLPASITASKIAQTASYRFVTDTEKTTWNNKLAAESDTLQSVTDRGATTTKSIIMDNGSVSTPLLIKRIYADTKKYRLQLDNTDTLGRILHYNETDSTYKSEINFLVDNSITFKQNQSEKIRIDANGNVGIGTSSPETKFHVNGLIKGNSHIFSQFNVARSELFSFDTFAGWNALDSNGVQQIRLATTGNNFINYNLGIGTTSPSERLEVAGNVKIRATSAKIIIDDPVNRFPSIEFLRGNAAFGTTSYYDYRIKSEAGYLNFFVGGSGSINDNVLSLYGNGNITTAGDITLNNWTIKRNTTTNALEFFYGGSKKGTLTSGGELHAVGDVVAFSTL